MLAGIQTPEKMKQKKWKKKKYEGINWRRRRKKLKQNWEIDGENEYTRKRHFEKGQVYKDHCLPFWASSETWINGDVLKRKKTKNPHDKSFVRTGTCCLVCHSLFSDALRRKPTANILFRPRFPDNTSPRPKALRSILAATCRPSSSVWQEQKVEKNDSTWWKCCLREPCTGNG